MAYDDPALRRSPRRRRDDHARPAGHAQRALRRAARRADRGLRARRATTTRCAASCSPPRTRESFSSGANLGGFAADVPLVHKHFGDRALPALFTLIGELGKPTICAANGHVLAGALGIALACDLIVAKEGATLRHARDQRRRVPVHDHGADLPQRAAQEDERAAAARRAHRARRRRERIGHRQQGRAGGGVRRGRRRLGGEARGASRR